MLGVKYPSFLQPLPENDIPDLQAVRTRIHPLLQQQVPSGRGIVLRWQGEKNVLEVKRQVFVIVWVEPKENLCCMY